MLIKRPIWRKYIVFKDGNRVLSDKAPEEAKTAYESYRALTRLGYEDGFCSDREFDKLVADGLIEERLRPKSEWLG